MLTTQVTDCMLRAARSLTGLSQQDVAARPRQTLHEAGADQIRPQPPSV